MVLEDVMLGNLLCVGVVLLKDTFHVGCLVEVDLAAREGGREVVARWGRLLTYTPHDRLWIVPEFKASDCLLDDVEVEQDGPEHALQFEKETQFWFST